tara:strand:- start:373 stop:609 length:237 start_codon:yes stop_codon:yes gene_type:complete
METLTEKINEATKKAFFLINAKKTKGLTSVQLLVLHQIAHNETTLGRHYKSIEVLKRKNLIKDKISFDSNEARHVIIY